MIVVIFFRNLVFKKLKFLKNIRNNLLKNKFNIFRGYKTSKVLKSKVFSLEHCQNKYFASFPRGVCLECSAMSDENKHQTRILGWSASRSATNNSHFSLNVRLEVALVYYEWRDSIKCSIY